MSDAEARGSRPLSTEQIAAVGADSEDRELAGEGPALDREDREFPDEDPALDRENAGLAGNGPALGSENDLIPVQDPALDSDDRATSPKDPLSQDPLSRDRLSQGPLPAPARQPVPAQEAAPPSEPGTGDLPRTQLLEDDELRSIRLQWKDIQAGFVDEPRKAVQDADALVAELMQRLAQMFASEREQLESRWADGEDVSTEELRRRLRRYRSFFERLVAA